MRLKKKKEKTVGQLKKEAWKIFSLVVRRSAAGKNGLAGCVTCGGVGHWKKLQAGHFVPKSKGLVFWFIRKNVHPQCRACNIFDREWAKIQYTLYMQKRYGMGIVEELCAMRGQEVSYGKGFYSRLILDLKADLAKLGPET